MKGYVIVDTEIADPAAYAEFLERVPAIVESHGGRFLVRTINAEPVEGGWAPRRLVIIEFDSLAAAKGYIESAEYAALNDLRLRATSSRSVVAEGCS